MTHHEKIPKIMVQKFFFFVDDVPVKFVYLLLKHLLFINLEKITLAVHFRDNINENFFEEIYMKLRPLADRVLAKPEKAETKTASGIIIPDAAQEKTQTAVIEAVGPGTDKEKITVKVGERVMYDKYAGTSVKIDGEEYLILKNSDIVAVIEN